MNENQGRRGPNPALLLLIPAALIIAKGASRRRRMWETGGYGRHRGFGGELDPTERESFRLPPRIESMLDAWHTRTHEKAAPGEPPKDATATV